MEFLKLQSQSFKKEFERIANKLLNEYLIKAGENYYRIVDCEFYYNDNNLHEDKYTHSHELQKEIGSWYFHGSGIDITFGDKEKGVYGGILIRGIAKVINEEPFVKVDNPDKRSKTLGPLNTLTTLFSNYKNVFSGNSKMFHLIHKDESDVVEYVPIEKIFCSNRNGLNETRDEKHFKTNYRFAIFEKLPHVGKEMLFKSENVIDA